MQDPTKKLTNYNSAADLLAALRKVKGPIYIDAAAGANFDPIPVQIVKADAIEALEEMARGLEEAPWAVLEMECETHLVSAH